MKEFLQNPQFYRTQTFQSSPISSFFYTKRLPAKLSSQVSTNARKMKTFQEDRRKSFSSIKFFDLQQAKNKLEQVEKNRQRITMKTVYNSSKATKQRCRSIGEIEKIPELCIEKEPIRYQTQTSNKKARGKYSNLKNNGSGVILVRKKRESQPFLSPMSKSMLIRDLQSQKICCHLTQVIEKEQICIKKMKLNSKRKHKKNVSGERKKIKVKKGSREAKSKENQQKYKVQQNIKGWDNQYFIKDLEQVNNLQMK